MSGIAVGWVAERGPTVPSLRYMLVMVAQNADKDGCNAHPGVKRLASQTCLGERQVMRTLAKLVKDGWLEVEAVGGGRGKATSYRLSAKLRPLNPGTQTTVSGAERVTSVDVNPDIWRLNPDMGLAKTSPNGFNNEVNNASLLTQPSNGTHPAPVDHQAGLARMRALREEHSHLRRVGA